MGARIRDMAFKQPPKKRFVIGAQVRVRMPGVNGVVIQADDEPAAMGEYWHRVKTKNGERREPGSNLELVPKAIGGESASSNNMVLQSRLVEYFRSLEKALNEHKEKGTPGGDPVYQKIYEQLTGDVATLGVGQDQLEALAAQCGHGSTLIRLEKLRKKPIGFSSDK